MLRFPCFPSVSFKVPETVYLAEKGREFGAGASSAFGAGFGGSVWAYLAKADAPAFMERWKTDYTAKYPEPAKDADFFIDTPGPGAFQLF